MKALVSKFWKEEDGLETVEYAIILALIVVGTIGAVTTLGTWVYDKFTTLNGQLAGN